MSAIISKCGQYRYRLERIVGTGNKICLFIMLNPSTADATINDQTIKRCMGYAAAWGYGRLIVGNLFAYRATVPEDMKNCSDPEGPDNLRHLKKMCAEAHVVVAAWGLHGNHLGQHEKVLAHLSAWNVPVHVLKLTKDGHPNHPSRLSGSLKPQKWK